MGLGASQGMSSVPWWRLTKPIPGLGHLGPPPGIWGRDVSGCLWGRHGAGATRAAVPQFPLNAWLGPGPGAFLRRQECEQSPPREPKMRRGRWVGSGNAAV